MNFNRVLNILESNNEDKHLNSLIELLQKAYCDEWLAYMQYWLGSKVISGTMEEEVGLELSKHASEELNHLNMITSRILQLGGEINTNPKEWHTQSNCKFTEPTDPYPKQLLLQNIKGEQCAITVYKEIMDLTRDIDPLTYFMAEFIYHQEIEHASDLQMLLNKYNSI